MIAVRRQGYIKRKGSNDVGEEEPVRLEGNTVARVGNEKIVGTVRSSGAATVADRGHSCG